MGSCGARLVRALFGLAAMASCAPRSSSPASRTGPQAAEARATPEWFREAIAESRRTLEPSCVDFAPLGILFTPDPAWHECQTASHSAIRVAWEGIYAEALERCVGGARYIRQDGCCFAQSGNSVALEMGLQRKCDLECRARRRPPTSEPTALCASDTAALRRSKKSRAHTAAVEWTLARCAIERARPEDCNALPSWVEQAYCARACRDAAEAFSLALDACVSNRAAGAGVHCAPLEGDARTECEGRCAQVTAVSASP